MISDLQWHVIVTIALTFFFTGPAFAEIPTRAAIDAACKPGSDPHAPGDEAYPGGLSPKGGGLTPQRLPGATTVSVREAKCIIDQFGKNVLILDAMSEGDLLPGALEAGSAANIDPSLQALYVNSLAQLTHGDKNYPIITYCHHERCFLSYNVALRTVQAGYSNVFWMRPGIAAWKAAGYAVVSPPPPPGEVEASPEVLTNIKNCRDDHFDYTVYDWASLWIQFSHASDQEKEFDEQRLKRIDDYKKCLDDISENTYGAANKAEIAKAQDAADGEVSELFYAARRSGEEDAAQYLSFDPKANNLTGLKETLATLRAVKTLEQTCGTFDFSQPAISGDPANINFISRLRDRRTQYGNCITNYYHNTKAYAPFDIAYANKKVKATRRYTCSVVNRPNCIPAEPFNSIAAVASDANLNMAKKNYALSNEEKNRVRDIINKLNTWADELNRRIDNYNAGY